VATVKYVSLQWLGKKYHTDVSLQVEPCIFESAEQQIDNVSLLEFLNLELKKLSPKQQRAFYLRLDGLTYQQIGSDMHISLFSAASHVRRAKNKLQAALKVKQLV